MKNHSRCVFVVGLYLLFGLAVLPAFPEESKPPVRIAIIGLVHTHVRGFLPQALTIRRCRWLGLWSRIGSSSRSCRALPDQHEFVLPQPGGLFAKTNAQAVATFTSTFDHRRVVEACAPRGIHVMMESRWREHGARARHGGSGQERRRSSARQL